LQTFGYLGIILIDLEPLGEIEAECGSGVYNRTIGQICEEITRLRRDVVRSVDLLCTARPYGEQILIFLEGPRRNQMLSASALEGATDRIWSSLSPKVSELLRAYGSKANVRMGYSLALPN